MTVKQVIIDELRHLALSSPAKECCGLIKGGGVIQLQNTHDEPDKHFMIKAGDTAEALEADCIWHTHTPQGFTELTPADIRTAEFLRRPILMVNGRGKSDYYDPNEILPFEGRTWRTYHRNCYSLMKDWYRDVAGVHLPWYFLDNPEEFRRGGHSKFLDHMRANGFREKTGEFAYHVGDVILSTEYKGCEAWHCSVLCNVFPTPYCLSQFITRRSCRFPLKVLDNRIHSVWRYVGC